MINLENVTLVSVTSVNIDRTIRALKYSTRGINFGDVVLMTDKYVSPDVIKTIKIQELDYIEYSRFIIYELYKYINTEFVLIIQDDGFVINPDKWDDDFLKYDYIGAPFQIPPDGDNITYRDPFGNLMRVGNGGFSLRSKKILSLASELDLEWKSYFGFYNEDGFFACHNRHIYESHGCVYAPVDVAARFSIEAETAETIGITPFGFHGKGKKYNSLIQFDLDTPSTLKSPFFVITDYNHLPQDLSTSWVNKYANGNYLIYDRSDRWEETDKIKKQINVGENIYDMFDFIVNNYNNLPEVMVFVKADVVPRHCGEEKFAKIINNKEYTPIENYSRTVTRDSNAYAYVDGDDGYMEDSREIGHVLQIHPGKYFKSYREFFYEVYDDPEFSNYIRFAPGGCHLITKKDILRYNKHFYEMLREITGWAIRPGEAFILERGIYTIYTNNFTIKEKYRA